jgi:microcystin-dependent protein
LIGTTYGGDGQTSFGLPNLQGRTPIGTGQGLGLPNYVIGQAGGAEAITLTSSNMPVHTHALLAAQIPVGSTADSNDPTNNYFGPVTPTNAGTAYDPANNGVMAAGNTNSGITGGGAPFSIMSPYLVVNYCISLEGIYPQRN